VGLSNVDNTADIDKPVSIAQKTAILDILEEDGSYYLTTTSSDLGAGRYTMTRDIPAAGGGSVSGSALANGDTIAEFASVSGFPNVTQLPAGPLSFHIMASQTAGTKETRIYAEFYFRTLLGFNTLLGTSELSDVLTGTPTMVRATVNMPVTRDIEPTDRLLVIFKVDVSGAGTDPDVSIFVQGVNYSRARFPNEANSVISVAGKTGIVTLAKADVGLSNVDNTSDLSKPISNATQSALDLKQDAISANENELLVPNDSGTIVGSGIYRTPQGGLSRFVNLAPANGGSISPSFSNISISPTENSPNENYTFNQMNIEIDPASSGFTIGTNGNAIEVYGNNINHAGTSDIGGISFIKNYFSIGNGTDPINVKGFSYGFGFGNINANVNINGAMQGYGYQPTFDDLATVDAVTGYTNAFYDFTYAPNVTFPSFTSFVGSPSIGAIANNNSYTGLNLSPTVGEFLGNSGCNVINIGGDYGTFDTGNWKGINISPSNITSVNNAVGLYISMASITPYAGIASELTIQDLTFTFNDAGDNSSFTLEFADTAIAGSETIGVAGTTITIGIESGVSTATQVKAACDGNPTFVGGITTTISGTAGNAQVSEGPTNFGVGASAGNKRAIEAVGDTQLTGSLTFSGALSIGQLNAFYSSEPINQGGNPQILHGMTTQMIAQDSTTVANGDTIGVNNAMLVELEDNSVTTSGAFKLGFAAVGLPCVVKTGTGSSLDYMNMALYALNLDPGSTGGTIGRVNGVRVEAIPNGVTTVDEFVAFEFNQTFGQVGTDVWGLNIVPTYANNFLGSSLAIGTSNRKVSNDSVALEVGGTTKAILLSAMNTTQRDAMTPINGMIFYNETTGKFQGRAAGSWVDLH
jgi:hypothetical protein